MKGIALIAIFVSLSSQAATNTAASVSLANVTTAYNACSDGDTLAIPSGSATWTSGLTVTKAISILGAGSNAVSGTIITKSGTISLFTLQPALGSFIRLSGICFKLADWNSSGGNYPIQVLNGGRTRIDHCWFTNGQYVVTYTYNSGTAYGVIDHNTFWTMDNAIQMNGNSTVWTNAPITPGTTNCLVIEDNKFITTASVGSMNENIMSGHGVRFVVRYNTFDGNAYSGNDFLPYENHGKGGTISTSPPSTDELRGPPIFEIYNNTMSGQNSYRLLNIRGGSCLVWSNTMTVSASSGDINVTEDNYDPLGWSGIDQIENSFFWNNTWNGALMTNVTIQVQTSTNQIILNRDYFLHSPDGSSGKITWSDWAGSHNATFNSGVAQAYYPYTPLVYPHPIVTAQDGGGDGGSSHSVASGTFRNVRLQ